MSEEIKKVIVSGNMTTVLYDHKYKLKCIDCLGEFNMAHYSSFTSLPQCPRCFGFRFDNNDVHLHKQKP